MFTTSPRFYTPRYCTNNASIIDSSLTNTDFDSIHCKAAEDSLVDDQRSNHRTVNATTLPNNTPSTSSFVDAKISQDLFDGAAQGVEKQNVMPVRIMRKEKHAEREAQL